LLHCQHNPIAVVFSSAIGVAISQKELQKERHSALWGTFPSVILILGGGADLTERKILTL
jgi:hypothetical protein